MHGISVQTQAPDVATPVPRELRGVSRLAVVGLAAVAMVLAIPGGLGIIFAVSFGAVGGLLAIRRPTTPIGWLLLGIAYAFAFVSMPIAATVDELRGGSADALDRFLVIMTGLSGGAAFLFLAVLAFVFPTGTLPSGRWGSGARIGLGVGIAAAVLGAVTPTMTVSLVGQQATVRVPNPIAVLPDLPLWQVITQDTAILPLLALLAFAAASLAARFWGSSGIERQQLRWLGAALILVVVAVVVGLVISSVAPTAGESGLAWIPAMLAFPGIPLSILVAVLRYRLYEIDTIINRAIVYGVLTAILAGVSSAVVTVGKDAFEGMLGPGSDFSIVLSTVVVVSAFEPIKKRVSRLVDARFKEAHPPSQALGAFLEATRAQVAAPDRDRTLRRFLDVALAAFRGTGGELRWVDGASTGVIRMPDHVTVTGGSDPAPPSVAPPDVAPDPGPRLVATGAGERISATIEIRGVAISGPQEDLQAALQGVLGELR
jgi:hypothetical protein